MEQREIVKGGGGNINCKSHQSLVYFSHLSSICSFLLKGEVKRGGNGHGTMALKYVPGQCLFLAYHKLDSVYPYFTVQNYKAS